MSKTLYDKLWDAHVVRRNDDGSCLIYIDRQLVHEVTSPQAFDGLRLAKRDVWRRSANLATADHNVPTTDRARGIAAPTSRVQVETLDSNCDEFGITEYKMNALRQGIVHVIGPEAGATLPGMTVVCGDSHTSTHGALEAGARAGMVAAVDKTVGYVRGRRFAPTGELWDQAVAAWRDLHSDADAHFDRVVRIDASSIKPQVSWGTSPEMVTAVDARVPDPAQESDPVKREGMARALKYKGLAAGTPITDIQVDKVFIGSCTNSRIEDLRAAAAGVRGRQKAAIVKQVLIVPGSGLVKKQAEEEGLDEIFTAAGFEWREPGCSMCLAMNADRLEPGERCASTSNRNFEGRQGAGGRTHLVSPAMAAAAAVAGHFVDVRDWN